MLMTKCRLRDVLIDAARVAGEIQLGHIEDGDISARSKYGGNDTLDMVTIADIKTEEALREFFDRTMPEYNVIGEESGGTYNGNGKVILIDPLDCTKSYMAKLPNFGPIIGIYDKGKNIAGIEHNVTKGIMYVATEESGFERIGPREEIPKDAIYLESKVSGQYLFAHKLAKAVKEEFQNYPIIVNSQNVLNKARVFNSEWKAFFHAGQARHDIAAVPIFSRLSGVKATDHNGIQYELLNPEIEIERYNSGKNEAIYSNTILVSQPDCQERFLEVLNKFKEELDEARKR